MQGREGRRHVVGVVDAAMRRRMTRAEEELGREKVERQNDAVGHQRAMANLRKKLEDAEKALKGKVPDSTPGVEQGGPRRRNPS